MLGLIWVFAYFAVELVSPGALALKMTFDLEQHLPREMLAELIYFSFVTLTTLGYGDISPVSSLARSLTITEALIGQVFLAVVIARLVGLQISSGIKED